MAYSRGCLLGVDGLSKSLRDDHLYLERGILRGQMSWLASYAEVFLRDYIDAAEVQSPFHPRSYFKSSNFDLASSSDEAKVRHQPSHVKAM